MVPAEQIVMALTPDSTVRSAAVPSAIDLMHRFLVGEFGLDPREMTVVGRGEDEPLLSDGTEHAHAINRRVEVVRR